MNTDKAGQAWLDEAYDSPLTSTTVPELLAQKEAAAIGTLIVIVIAAVVTISLLFAVAVFLDCRQQKVVKQSSNAPLRKKLAKIKFPSLGRKRQEDEENFADKIQVPESSGVIPM